MDQSIGDLLPLEQTGTACTTNSLVRGLFFRTVCAEGYRTVWPLALLEVHIKIFNDAIHLS
ncbi:hypothetical protein R7040_30080, partial [Vibrio sp. 1069]|uniref:hypothetical protein n=1 Tax=Vibrio sp. 1069 TaxID=3074541 RepID=UPI0029644DCD